MAAKPVRLYHFFLVLIPFNIVVFYIFIGDSLLNVNNLPEINYLAATSAALAIIWFLYHLFRKKIDSSHLLLAHLIFVGACILVVPPVTIRFMSLPRRYLERSDSAVSISEIFGFMEVGAVVQGILFLSSMLFLVSNIRRTQGM